MSAALLLGSCGPRYMMFDGPATTTVTDGTNTDQYLAPTFSNGYKTIALGSYTTSYSLVTAAFSSKQVSAGLWQFPFSINYPSLSSSDTLRLWFGLANSGVYISSASPVGSLVTSGMAGNAALLDLQIVGLSSSSDSVNLLSSAAGGNPRISTGAVNSGAIFVLYFNFTAGTWGFIDNAGTDHPNMQSQSDGLSGTMGLPSGSLSLLARIIGSSEATTSSISLLTQAQLTAASRSGKSGYSYAFG